MSTGTTIGPGRALLAAGLLMIGMTSCTSTGNTEKGAVIGAAAGGAVGAAVGKAAGSTTKGAIIGAVLGGTAGAIIGRRMDDKADELDAELENAEVERVGEGILVTFDSGILFDFDSSTLRPEARRNLAELARVLAEETEDYELMVAGHTDSVGTASYNQALSERRARAGAEFLMTRGIPPSHIRPVGLGETEPVADNSTDAGRQLNRRVEVAIFASQEYREEVTGRVGSRP